MNAQVFKPTNEWVGRFAVRELSQVDVEFRRFTQAQPVEHGYYVECSGKTWTVVSQAGSFVLTEGRVGVGPARGDAPGAQESLGITPSTLRFWLLMGIGVCAYPLLLLCDRGFELSYRLVSAAFPVCLVNGVVCPLLAVKFGMPGRSLLARIIVFALGLMAVIAACAVATMAEIANSDWRFF